MVQFEKKPVIDEETRQKNLEVLKKRIEDNEVNRANGANKKKEAIINKQK